MTRRPPALESLNCFAYDLSGAELEHYRRTGPAGNPGYDFEAEGEVAALDPEVLRLVADERLRSTSSTHAWISLNGLRALQKEGRLKDHFVALLELWFARHEQDGAEEYAEEAFRGRAARQGRPGQFVVYL